MSTRTRWAVVCVIAAIVVGGLLWAFLAGRKEQPREAERERPIEAASRVSTKGNRIAIRMTPSEAAQNGIILSALQPAAPRREIRAPAMVLSGQELNDLRNNYVAAKAQLQKAQAALNTSLPEYERLKALYERERNASLSALQAAKGTMTSDEAAANAARDSLLLVESGVRQRWGPVVADWLYAGSPALKRLLLQQDLLIQATPPAGTEEAPASIRLEVAGHDATARFVSPLPRLDPRIQAPSYLYVAQNIPGLVPGMNLVALLPSGPPVHGVFVPRSAAVWWQGKAWVYVHEDNKFVQRLLPTDFPVDDGWIAENGFSQGEEVVTRGAQQLLSEVFRSEIRTGEEGR